MDFNELAAEWRSSSRYLTAHTSGSTGTPRTIALPKSFVARSAKATNEFFNINSSSRLHSCVSADFIGGKMMWIRAELAGGHFTWEKPSNRPLRTLSPEEQIDLLAVVPSQMIDILDRIGNLPALKNIIIGGSAIHPGLRRRICESPLCCYETYGMTETASHIALRHISIDDGNLFHTIGGVRVELDARGCLVACFPTGERVVTNDFAELYGDTEFTVCGRIDDVVVTGGKKVNPQEVEHMLEEIMNVRCHISSVPDVLWGERVVAVVCDHMDADRLIKSDMTFLEPFKRPKDVVCLESLPLLDNGKIDRRMLRQLVSKLFNLEKNT